MDAIEELVDDWITLEDGGALRVVAEKYVPHLGQASFFELSWVAGLCGSAWRDPKCPA